jgi:hypothetical protein
MLGAPTRAAPPEAGHTDAQTAPMRAQRTVQIASKEQT